MCSRVFLKGGADWDMTDFYEADEPVERVQGIRERPPDFVTAAPAPLAQWFSIAPADAVGIDLTQRPDITAPRNEAGERCPWPWEPQQLVGVPLGQYHCQYCGAMVLAGVPHIDYGFDGE